MDDDLPIDVLATRAAAGDQDAWNDIVHRYSPLLVRVIRMFRLTAGETEDVAQTVWLRLIEHLDSLREPRAMPMWIITTAKRESLRLISAQRRVLPNDPQDPTWFEGNGEPPDFDGNLLKTERHQALLAGLAELPGRQRHLLLLLLEDPPLSYAEIGRRCRLPIGSIGPTRARALERLRATPSVRAYRGDFDHV